MFRIQTPVSVCKPYPDARRETLSTLTGVSDSSRCSTDLHCEKKMLNFWTNRVRNNSRPLLDSASAGAGSVTRQRPSSLLGTTLHIKGAITGSEELLIEGSVDGTIDLGSKLIVGKAAKLIADISADHVVVFGTVKGNVRATGQIDIKKDGSVIGNLKTTQVLIEDGAGFKGSIEINRDLDNLSDDARREPPLRTAHARDERLYSTPVADAR